MTYRQELGRKAIHLGSSIIPIAYFFVSKPLILSLLIPATLLTITIDYGRRYVKWMDTLFNFLFGYVLRDDEEAEYSLTGGSYVMLAEVIAILLFPKFIAIAGLLTLSIGDSAAALIGRPFGKHKLYGEKTWEGTLAFLISSVIVVSLIPGIPIWAAILSSVAGACVELFFNVVDDNIFIPVASGIVLVLLAVG
ncbi:MAG: SEC59/DGK1/VTE5 family protein [Candidatus Marinimicrobia bacterium]|nr:SEC59/DGK1/VTE5 family protein [Candidatus Neomarinimicrobiota bacterium]MCF7829851.1 SEC59/DGK1/VTE5 family protein [Candidatus Neomarinimicrobiota bacterium]MCF7882479.1 SEC59/DGK1/VTE5 family protein [Candidatus Neomarinimicrobiota bacterium]